MKKAICFDIGGTNFRSSLINENYEIEKINIKSTNCSSTEDFLEAVDNAILEIGLDDVCGISFGVPGRVRKDGFVFRLANINIGDIPLKKHVEEKFNIPCHVKNDAEMASLGEGMLGVGKGKKACYFITISTGVGGALERNGKIVVTSDEIGHSLIPYKNQYFEFEKLNSGRFLVDLAKDFGLEIECAKQLFELKNSGNELALAVYKQWLENLTNLFQFISKYMDVNTIALSGGVMKSSDIFLDDLRSMNPNLDLEVSLFGQNVGLIGCAYYAFNN